MDTILKTVVMGKKRAAAPPLEFSDTFTDTNTTSLADHTPDTDSSRNGWTVQQGAMSISANKAIGAGTTTDINCATFDVGKADGNFEAYLSTPANGASYIAVRFTDITNMWIIGIRQATHSFRIIKIEAGTPTIKQEDASITVTENTLYKVNVSVSDAEIVATIDGAHTLTESGATFNQTATKHGLRIAGVGNADGFFLFCLILLT